MRARLAIPLMLILAGTAMLLLLFTRAPTPAITGDAQYPAAGAMVIAFIVAVLLAGRADSVAGVIAVILVSSAVAVLIVYVLGVIAALYGITGVAVVQLGPLLTVTLSAAMAGVGLGRSLPGTSFVDWETLEALDVLDRATGGFLGKLVIAIVVIVVLLIVLLFLQISGMLKFVVLIALLLLVAGVGKRIGLSENIIAVMMVAVVALFILANWGLLAVVPSP